MKKFLISLAMFSFLLMPALTLVTVDASAAASTTEGSAIFFGDINSGAERSDLKASLGLGESDPRAIIAGIIKVAMGFLGVVAVIIIILGGFKWMTAAGAEDKVEEAKKLITAGIIGLIIIMAAWGLATFVLKSIYSATGGNAS